jgi:hypothetical protein
MGRPPNSPTSHSRDSDDRERHGHQDDHDKSHGHEDENKSTPDTKPDTKPAEQPADDLASLADQIAAGLGPDEAAPNGDPNLVPTVEIPAFKVPNKNQTGMLGIEALEGYFYGQRTRVDHNGMTWDYRREPLADQWQLAIRVTFAGVQLVEAFVPLDQVASRDGEQRVLATVEGLAERACARAADLRKQQQAMKSDAAQTANTAAEG